LKNAAEQMNRRKPKHQKTDAHADVTVIANTTTETAVVAEEAEKGYDLLVVGLGQDHRPGQQRIPLPTSRSSRRASTDRSVIADARDGLLNNPTDGKLSILVPVNGTEPSRRAAEVAFAIGPRRPSAGHGASMWRRPPTAAGSGRAGMADAMLKDIVALGESYDVDAKTAVRTEHMATTPSSRRSRSASTTLS
jgi:hypothetical protein